MAGGGGATAPEGAEGPPNGHSRTPSSDGVP